MYKRNKMQRTTLSINESVEGETLEQKLDRVLNNGEPISDGAPKIFTERKDGVLPEYNVRTDRWEIAIDGTDIISKSHQAKRADRIEQKEAKIDPKKGENNGEAEPARGKD